MSDPSTSEWRSIMSDKGLDYNSYPYRASVNGSRPPTVAEVLAANEAAKKLREYNEADERQNKALLESVHRYTYPADAGDVPAGTRFNQDYLVRDNGTLVDNHPVVPTVKFDQDINMPSHYTHLPVEAIDITEHFNFNMGNALKYIWRADYKGDPVKDLRKAAWYIDREIARRERE